MTNIDKFRAELKLAYSDLFINNPEYAYSASRCTPESLALRMMPLEAKTFEANLDGEGIKRACKACGIKYTRKGINEFISK